MEGSLGKAGCDRKMFPCLLVGMPPRSSRRRGQKKSSSEDLISVLAFKPVQTGKKVSVLGRKYI